MNFDGLKLQDTFLLFIIQQLAMIASKLIVRSSAVHNSWLNPKISLKPNFIEVALLLLKALISTVEWGGCSCVDRQDMVSVKSPCELLGSSEM